MSLYPQILISLIDDMSSQLIFRLATTVPSFTISFAPVLSSIAIPIISYAQEEDDSETTAKQTIRQKNVCSGWAICVNIAENREDSPLTAEKQTLDDTPN
jgi:hypothetical protein